MVIFTYLLGKVAGLVGFCVYVRVYIYLLILTEYNEQNEQNEQNEKVFGLVYVYVWIVVIVFGLNRSLPEYLPWVILFFLSSPFLLSPFVLSSISPLYKHSVFFVFFFGLLD